jgi:acetyl-CoA carboxylase/biotin carboxylase 1
VEHPVSELISNVNLPAALLCVGLGVPLHRIPEVRAYYGEDPYTDSLIDFDRRQPNPARGHAIAVRVTAEDTENGFRPTCGNIDEINFRDSRDCWGYFSVAGGGGIHQFADSQFGHIFATGNNREEARRSMALALRNLSIRGEIRTSTAYVLELLETREFRDCDCNTAWLDGLIANRPPRPKQADVHPALAAAAIYRHISATSSNVNRFTSFLSAGHTPATEYLVASRTETFVLSGEKYIIECGRLAQNEYRLRLNNTVLAVYCRQMSHGALQITVGGRNLVAYVEEEGTNLRAIINGRSLVFTGDADPTKLRSSVTGRLVRFLAADGDHITEGQAYCEVEVMKMILRLNSGVTGTMHIRAAAGSTLTNGKLLAEVEPDDPSKVARAVVNAEPWPTVMAGGQGSIHADPAVSPSSASAGKSVDALTRARNAVDALHNMIQGYHFEAAVPLSKRLADAFADLSSLSLTSVTLQSLNRPFLMADEAATAGALSPSSGTPIKKLHAVFAAIVNAFLQVEQWYDGRSREEALVALRQAHDGDVEKAYHVDFAHSQTFRFDVVKAILQYIDSADASLMSACKDVLERLASLKNPAVHGAVLLESRYLLRKAAVPSFDQRKADLIRRVEQQEAGSLDGASVPTNLLCAVLFDRRNTHLVPVLMEVIARRFYYGEGTVSNVDVVKGADASAAWVAYWQVTRENQTAPLGRHPRSESSRLPSSPMAPGAAASGETVPGVVRLRNSNGMMAVFTDERGLAEASLAPFIQDAIARSGPRFETPSRGGAGSNVSSPSVAGSLPTLLYCFFGTRDDVGSEKLGDMCRDALAPFADRLADSSIERITFCAYNYTKDEPTMYTFARMTSDAVFGGGLLAENGSFSNSPPFTVEDRLLRNVFPSIANRLELGRLRNYDIAMYPTPVRKAHIFVGTPKAGKSGARATHKRLFVRAYIAPGDVDLAPWSSLSDVDCGRVMSLVTSAVELAQSDRKLGDTVYNHLFVNLIELTLDLKTLPLLFRELARTYAKSMYELGFREVEVKFLAARNASPTEQHTAHVKGHGFVPFRVFITNHTRYSINLECFVEVEDGDGGITLHRARFADDVASGASFTVAEKPQLLAKWGGRTGTSSLDLASKALDELHTQVDAGTEEPVDPRWEALRDMLPERVDEPFSASDRFSGAHHTPASSKDAYAPLTQTQLRRLQAQASGTTYGHDWLTLIEVVVRKKWQAFVSERGLLASVVPRDPVEVQQLFLDETTDELKELSDSFTPTPAMQTAGMLVWNLTLLTPADWDHATQSIAPRSVVLVANDITAQFGSFSVTEDKVFAAASVLARAGGRPFIYLSANSGARLGLVSEVKQCFRAAFKADGAVDYLYLVDADYQRLASSNVAVQCEAVSAGSEKRWKILDVIGADHEHIGVENLQGSALIAGQMSLNYATIPTLSVVSGRSVGIGAYLVRLGRRVVQAKNSPIILTGAPAINKLLGKEVYASNNQLGGTQIMLPNGVSHFPASDDLDATRVALQWLDFMPMTVATATTNPVPRLVAQPAADPVDRDVTFSPQPATPYDPRFLLQGDREHGTLGLFDRGSWMESLGDWAKTVVAGRATLGGIPVGVIVVETRSVQKYDPADPADPESQAAMIAQAGQVWFPDSARKTADALEDFHKERLPCFILANWRGFSGGMRDMFDEVLKFGASIVDNLRVYDRPVFIYIPPFGELRGGAWVVVDPVINHQGTVTMYADPNARGGILEPAGMCEIKFRAPDVLALMRRNDAELSELTKKDPAAAKKREEQLRAQYNDAAIKFADLHDTPGRMLAKGCVSQIVPWAQSRRVFHSRLVRKIAEIALAETLAGAIAPAGAHASLPDGIAALRRVADASKINWNDDKSFAAWAASDAAQGAIAAESSRLRAAAVVASVSQDPSLDDVCARLLAAGGADFRAAMERALAQKK